MKFQIMLTSAGSTNHNQQPHPKAVLEEVTIEDRKVFPWNAVSEALEWNWEVFQKAGSNHRREDRVFFRSMKAMRWFIEIESLEELVAIAKQAEQENPERGIIFDGETIEIYDSYRE